MNAPITNQIVVVGAGPAGLAATTTLIKAGARVLLIDAGERPGGQYWRHSAGSPFGDKHEEIRIVKHPNVEYLPNTNVWTATYRQGVSTLHLLVGGVRELTVTTGVLVVATGAYDRSLPFPGWDTPGVMTAGGVQALLKGQKRLAGKEIVVAGTGPFLLPVAIGLIMSGAKVKAIVETSYPTAWATKIKALANAGSKFSDFFKFQKIIREAKVKTYYKSAVIAAHGATELEAVTIARVDKDFLIKPGSEIKIGCDVLAVGWGFTPDLSLASALGCATQIAEQDGSLVVKVDEYQRTSLPGIYAVGEATGIGGSSLALTEGHIAGSHIAHTLGYLDSTGFSSAHEELTEQRGKQQLFADALLEIYRVADGWTTWTDESTVLCRCEEVSVGDVRTAIRNLGVSDGKSAKNFTRTGMGMCQGRICGQAVAEFVAKECNTKVTLQDLQGSAKRPVITPIPLGLLADETSKIPNLEP